MHSTTSTLRSRGNNFSKTEINILLNMMMLMMGMFGQSQNRSGSVPSGSVPNYLDFANDSSSDESDGKQHAV